ncbi:MAG: hypothetical protein HQL56_08570 [Magnetococcales bacterium]|nr:hypothetical protein [Magnetococcales bacterium]
MGIDSLPWQTSAVAPELRRKFLLLFSVSLLFLTLLSINLAWLNPYGNRAPNFRPFPDKVLMWQYDSDAWGNFWSAVYFPDYFRAVPTRIERPAALVPVKIIGEIYYAILRLIPVGDNSPGHLKTPKKLILAMAMAHYTVKFFLYLVGLWFFYRMLLLLVSWPVAMGASIILLFHPWVIISYTHFHQYDYQIINPIIMTGCLVELARREQLGQPKWLLLTLVSLLTGFLMLAKTTPVVLLAILAILLLRGRVVEMVLVIAGNVIVYGGYRLFLLVEDIPWWSEGIHKANYGKMLIEPLLQDGVTALITKTGETLWPFLVALLTYHTIWMAFACLGIVVLIRQKAHWTIPLFALLALGTTFVQALATGRLRPYMTSDLWFITVALSAVAVQWGLRQGYLRLKWLQWLTLAWIVIGVTWHIHLPWLSPAEQLTQNQPF